MKTLVETERETYETAWAIEAYNNDSPGGELFQKFLDMSKAEPVKARYGLWGVDRAATLLDAGCGAGKGALAAKAAGFDVSMCDITDSGLIDEARAFPFKQITLWDDVSKHMGVHDWVYCCDVLEHIPPAFTMLVVQRLLDASRLGVFLTISLKSDAFGLLIGKPLHQTVLSFVQWRDHLSALGEVVECRDVLVTGLYLVRKRC